jgi:hypothetical protein
MTVKTAGKAAQGDARRQLLGSRRPVSIRARRAEAAHCVYLYYLKVGRTTNKAKDTSAHYYFNGEDPIDDIRDCITTLASRIHENGLVDPTCHGTKTSDLICRRVSYFVIVVYDERGRKLNEDSLVFEDKIVEDDSQDNKGKHTFLPVEYFEVDILGSTNKLQVVYCKNSLLSKKHVGKKLGDDEREYFRHHLSFANGARIILASAGFLKPLFGDDDSGGTNMGPPVPPPAGRRHFHLIKRA